MDSTDSDCERLVEEMWQSYLCEENLDSFRLDEPAAQSVPFLNSQEETSTLNNNISIPHLFPYQYDEASLTPENNWESLENLFGLLEEVTLFEGHDSIGYQKSEFYSDGEIKNDNATKSSDNLAYAIKDVVPKNHSPKKTPQKKRKGSSQKTPKHNKQKKKKTTDQISV